MSGTAPHSDRWPPSQSLGATSQGTSQTSFSRLSSQDPQDLHGVRSRLEDILFPGEQEQPSFCFHHLSHYLKDSVAGMPTMCISNGPHYQVHVLKSQAAEAVSKRVVDPGIQEEHARALCWEALMLAVLAVLQPFITPSLYYIVCPVPANIQIIQERCSGPVHQVARLQAPHPRLAALSETERPGPPIPFADAISIMFQIALALSAAHSLKSSHEDHPGVMALAVIHGNVQPGNVLLRSSDKLPVICGWSHSMVRWRSAEGLQHVFSGAELPDDPVHNAPELQAAEDPQSALQALSDRTDVWGFALVSLFLLTGALHSCPPSLPLLHRSRIPPPLCPSGPRPPCAPPVPTRAILQCKCRSCIQSTCSQSQFRRSVAVHPAARARPAACSSAASTTPPTLRLRCTSRTTPQLNHRAAPLLHCHVHTVQCSVRSPPDSQHQCRHRFDRHRLLSATQAPGPCTPTACDTRA